MPIVVAGAGIAGLCVTVGLQRAGVPVIVVEEREHLRGGAGITLWPNALAALDDLGLGDAVRLAGRQVDAGAVTTPRGRRIRDLDRTALTAALGEPLIAIHRQRLMELLAARVRPGSIRWGSRVVGVRRIEGAGAAAGRVAVELADGQDLDASALVGADGIRSAVARVLNPGMQMAYSGFSAWRGVAGMELEAGGQVWGEGAEFGWVPLDEGQSYWFAARRAPEGQDRGSEAELAGLRGEFGRWRGPAADLIAATAPQDLARHDLHDRPLAKRWNAGPVVLIGDAAHPMRPNLGQGGCQGIEDAAVLSRLLAGRGDLAAASAEFTRLRRRRVAVVARKSLFMATMIGLRPAAIADALFHASSWLPQRMLLSQVAAVASAGAYRKSRG